LQVLLMLLLWVVIGPGGRVLCAIQALPMACIGKQDGMQGLAEGRKADSGRLQLSGLLVYLNYTIN
jgi:hypothetical protein